MIEIPCPPQAKEAAPAKVPSFFQPRWKKERTNLFAFCKNLCYNPQRRCGSGSVGRAAPCQGAGRGFEPRLPLHICSTRFRQRTMSLPDFCVGRRTVLPNLGRSDVTLMLFRKLSSSSDVHYSPPLGFNRVAVLHLHLYVWYA